MDKWYTNDTQVANDSCGQYVHGFGVLCKSALKTTASDIMTYRLLLIQFAYKHHNLSVLILGKPLLYLLYVVVDKGWKKDLEYLHN